MEVSGQLHALAALPQGKNPWHPLDRRSGGPQSRSRRGGEEKNLQPLPGIEPRIIQPVSQRYTNEVSRFLFPDVKVKLKVKLSLCFNEHHAMKAYGGMEV
jgi:hypothetical protein